ncbi:MAG: hypothetical protein ABIJ50_05950 [Pseudomonadota bacterium]
MDFKEHIEAAWQNTLKFIGPVLILTLVQIAVSVFSLGIMAPVTMAGYMQSLLRVLREGREPEVKDLFSEMRLFLPLAFFSLLVMVALIIGFTMLILPGILMTGGLVFGTIYMLPLMTDKKLGIMDAIKESWAMATRTPWTDQLILTLLYLLIVSLGGSVVVAVFFTQPLSTFLVLSVYEARLQTKISLTAPVVPPPPPAE